MSERVGKYELGRTLGEGTFGEVRIAVDLDTNERVAIKVIDKDKLISQNIVKQFKKQVSIMKMVKHKNVEQMIEILASKSKIYVIMELLEGGEFLRRIFQSGKLNEEQARFYFQQLVEGVAHCHKLGVCHRDLKPENMLLDRHGILKLSGFGVSAVNTESDNNNVVGNTVCGTPNYMAPEVFAGKSYDGKKTDVWGCGVILFVLLAGYRPFDESSTAKLYIKIKSADFTYPDWFSAEVRSLLDRMIVADPSVRASLVEVERHPWYYGLNEEQRQTFLKGSG